MVRLLIALPMSTVRMRMEAHPCKDNPKSGQPARHTHTRREFALVTIVIIIIMEMKITKFVESARFEFKAKMVG